MSYAFNWLFTYRYIQFQIIDLSRPGMSIQSWLSTVLVESAVWNPSIIFHIIAFISRYWHILLLIILFEVQTNGNWTEKSQSFELPFDMPVNSLDRNVNELEIGSFHLHSRWLKFTFWTSKFSSSYRSNWTGIWTGNSNGSWTDKQSPHFSTEIRIKATFFFM